MTGGLSGNVNSYNCQFMYRSVETKIYGIPSIKRRQWNGGIAKHNGGMNARTEFAFWDHVQDHDDCYTHPPLTLTQIEQQESGVTA